MNTEETVDLDTLVQEKMEADTDFMESLDTLDDDEKNEAVEAKRKEILAAEIAEGRKQAELARNYKIRAEKAEKKPEKEDKGSQYSIKDITALSKVHEDDLDEVTDFATYRKISYAEALKDPILKAILAAKEEERKTSLATNTRTARPSVKKADGIELNKNLAKGEVPDKGSSDAEELFWARRGGRRS